MAGGASLVDPERGLRQDVFRSNIQLTDGDYTINGNVLIHTLGGPTADAKVNSAAITAATLGVNRAN